MNKTYKTRSVPPCLAALLCGAALVVSFAAEARGAPHARGAGTLVTMHDVTAEGIGPEIGTVRVAATPAGLVFTPKLTGLVPGERGFHVHAQGSCAPAPNKDGQPAPAETAGGHYDPAKTNTHQGPLGHGHQGDLPVLVVAADGTATAPVTAPRLTLKEVHGKALMVHLGSDNFTDTPANGGGGPRIACGVIP